MSRFSRTVSSTSSVSSCGTTPSLDLMAGPSATGSRPRMDSSPPVGGETQPIMRMVDDLPAPFGPRKPNASPRRRSKSIPSTATKSPKLFVSPRARMSTSGSDIPPMLPGWPAISERIFRPAARTSGDPRRPAGPAARGPAWRCGAAGRRAHGILAGTPPSARSLTRGRKGGQVSFIRELYARFRHLIHELAKFGVIGGLAFVITYGGTNLLHVQGHVGPLTSNVLATVVATVFSFVGNRWWTFRHRERTGMSRETILFFVLNGVGLGIQLA